MVLKYKKINKSAKAPKKEPGNSGYDLYTTVDEAILSPLEISLFPTGIAVGLPTGYGFLLRERGSTGSKGISVRAGVVDSNYVGEVFVALQNLNEVPLVMTRNPGSFPPGDGRVIYDLNKAIAQGLIVETPHWELEEVEDLGPSDRGDGKLGSTGN